MNKSNVDWKADVVYPITLFSVACLILLLSSFSTKASYETASTFNAEISLSDYKAEAAFAEECCERTVSHTKGCENDKNYVFYLESDKKDKKGGNITDSYFMSSSSQVSWIECDNQIHFMATNLKANSGSGEIIDLDITYSGLTNTPPTDSPKANRCFDANTGGWKYYTNTDGVFISNQYGTHTMTERGAAFQIGVGANAQAASGYGASGWIHVDGETDGHWVKGDVNVQLSQACSPIGGGGNPSCTLSADIANGNIDLCNGESATLTVSPNGASDCSDCCTRPILDTKHCEGSEDYVLYLSDGKDNKKFSADGLVWKECADGSATIIGQAKASDGEIATIDIKYSGLTTIAPPASPKGSNCNGAEGSDFEYYTRLCGTVIVGGSTYDLARRGPAFQVGNGGNVTHLNTEYGGSGWFDIEGSGRWDRGDFNVQLGNKQCGGNDIIYAWDGPGLTNENIASVEINGAGTYSVTVTDCNGCTAEDNITVSESSITVSAGDDQSICDGAKATLTATGGTNFLWSTNETTATIQVMPSSTTEYTVVVTNDEGCEGTDDVTVTVGQFTEAQASNNGPITCETGEITITALPNGNLYSWTGPGGFTSDAQSPQVGTAGTYIVTVTNLDGCEDTAETVVEADEAAPDAIASNNGPICDGESIELVASSTTTNVSYAWIGEGLNTNQTANQNNTIAGLAPGSYDYTVTITNLDNGCTTSATTTVVVNANPASGISAQKQVCAGEVAQFSAVPPVNGASYSWTFDGPATPVTATDAVVDVIWADVPGNYAANLTVEKDGCISTYEHEITVTFEVIAAAGPDTTICQGGTAILDGTDSQGNGYLWEVVEGDPTSIDLGSRAGQATVSPLTTTTYRLKVDDVANECTKVDEVTVFVDVNLNPTADAGEIQSICQGDKVTLDATGSLPPVAKPNSPITYFWSPANVLDDPTSATPMATISETTTFDLMVVSEDGCIDTSSVVITILPCDVALEKTVSNSNPNVGETVTFTITVSNEGSLPLSGIEIIDAVPNGYSAISNISNGGGAAGNLITWSGISLPVSGSSLVTFDAVVEAPGAATNYLNTAQVTAMDQSDIDSDPANDDGDQSEDDEDNADLTPQLIDLSLIKTIDDATPSVGDIVTFTITVSNAGPSAATGVTVTDAIPNGYINANAVGGTVTGSTATWTGLSIAANGNTTVTLTAEVVAPDANTSYINIAEITAADQFDIDSTPGNGADTNGNGQIGSEDPDGSQDPADEDDGDDATIVPNGSIWGIVLEDTNDDNIGDAPIEGVTITLKDAAGNIVATQVTDADGKYDFLDLAPGDYTVEQSQPDGFDDVSDQDGSPDGDAGDSDDAVDDSIAVTVDAGEADMDNDFIEELLTSIWGDVTEDTDGDGLGDAPLVGVMITLKDAAGNVLETAVTDADGKYDFVGLPAGDYIVEEGQPDGYRDVSDFDESPDGDAGDSDTAVDNSITVTTTPGEADMDNDFVEEGLTSIWGDVTEDTNDDDAGENPIPGVTITLKDAAGNVLDTDVTDADGKYDFVGLPAGDYIVEQSQPAGYDDVSDFDESPDGDAGDSDTATDNSITVTTVANEADMDNDFIEELLTSIWGDVTEDTDGDGLGDTPIVGVTITLKDAAGTVLQTAVTDADGKYDFVGLPSGDYIVEETQPDNYQDLSDQDGSPDGDAGDSDTNVDNSITVTTTPGEADMDNDFVEEGLTSIWGDVTADDDNDGSGDSPIAGVTITLKDAAGNVLQTAITDADGKYDFVGLPAGDYIVEQTQPANYGEVSDFDESPDGDAGDSDTAQDNSITVTTVANEADMDNDFVEVLLTSIWGDVTEDIDGDGVGDAPIAGVTITLKDAAGNILDTEVTDANGKYDFINLLPGDYIVEETQPADYLDVSDRDESPDGDAGDSDVATDNSITVTTTPGEADMDNDFIEEGLTSIWGDVTEDIDGDGVGDNPIAGVIINLLDPNGSILETEVTDADGKYDFTGLPAGDYLVEEVQPVGFSDVSDRDESADGDAGDSDTTVDNAIAVTTTPNEADMDNDFIEEKLASISGNVLEDIDNDDAGDKPIPGVTILLKDAAGNTVAQDVTDANGFYEFLNIAPGTYTLMEMQPAGYEDVSDEDATPDPDGGNDPQDDSIPVILAAGENDDDNNFIEEQLVSVGSTVFEDVNDNGVQDAGEVGIAGVAVAIFEDNDMDGLPDNGTPLAQDITDANGNYYLGGLEPGKYVIIAQAPTGILNTSSTSNGGDDGIDGDDNGFQPLGSGTPAVSASITLTPDTEPTNESAAGGNLESVNGDQDNDGDMTIDFGFFAPGSLGDFVWFDINGNGKQDAGEPGLQGVTVNLLDANGNVVNTTTSDANGEYLFAGLTPDTYIVEFITPSSYTEVISTGTDINDENNSDYDPLTNRTGPIVIGSGVNELDVDAGFNLLLDVSLVSFTGRYVEDRNLNVISWITSSEGNSDYFILERSIDNGEFIAINKVDAKGNSSADALYNYDDTDIKKSGLYTYRLQQVSNDGTAIYSDIISINLRRSQMIDPTVNVFPNPASDIVNVDIVKGESDIVSAKLFDLTGKVIPISNVNVVAGSNQATLQIPVDNLPRAAYILRINIGDQVFAKKITLVN